MDFLDMFARPVKAVKRAFDFDADFGSSSLAGQLAATRNQLAQLQRQLVECNRLTREKDVLIEKLQRALGAKTVRPPVVPTSKRNDRTDTDRASSKIEETYAPASLETSRPTVEPDNRVATEPSDKPVEDAKPKRRRASTTTRKKKADAATKTAAKPKRTTRKRTTTKKTAAKAKPAGEPESPSENPQPEVQEEAQSGNQQ